MKKQNKTKQNKQKKKKKKKKKKKTNGLVKWEELSWGIILVGQDFFSSPEHEVLKVSYCDRSMTSSDVRRPSCGVNNLL